MAAILDHESAPTTRLLPASLWFLLLFVRAVFALRISPIADRDAAGGDGDDGEDSSTSSVAFVRFLVLGVVMEHGCIRCESKPVQTWVVDASTAAFWNNEAVWTTAGIRRDYLVSVTRTN